MFGIMQSEENKSGVVASSLNGHAWEASGLSLIASCPKCRARLTGFRNCPALIDSCGFETYNIQCNKCEARLVGIVDPLDEKLLVTPSEA